LAHYLIPLMISINILIFLKVVVLEKKLTYQKKKGKIKVQIGLAKGKKQYDKRRIIKDREINREKNRVLKKNL